MSTTLSQIEELAYAAYQERQYAEISLAGLERRASSLSVGGRASWQDGTWIPSPYPGYAMQAMLANSSNAKSLALDLQDLQYQLAQLVPQPGALYSLPAISFHQTIANTFSDDRLQRYLVATGKYSTFPGIVRERLERFPASDHDTPPIMRLIGISLFRTAIGILGVFENRIDFQRVVDFRDRFYGDPVLAELGLRRTRPFIGHVTLAYVESPLTAMQLSSLVEGIDAINQKLRSRRLVLELPYAQLHHYDDLSRFLRRESYPSIAL